MHRQLLQAGKSEYDFLPEARCYVLRGKTLSDTEHVWKAKWDKANDRPFYVRVSDHTKVWKLPDAVPSEGSHWVEQLLASSKKKREELQAELSRPAGQGPPCVDTMPSPHSSPPRVASATLSSHHSVSTEEPVSQWRTSLMKTPPEAEPCETPAQPKKPPHLLCCYGLQGRCGSSLCKLSHDDDGVNPCDKGLQCVHGHAARAEKLGGEMEVLLSLQSQQRQAEELSRMVMALGRGSPSVTPSHASQCPPHHLSYPIDSHRIDGGTPQVYEGVPSPGLRHKGVTSPPRSPTPSPSRHVMGGTPAKNPDPTESTRLAMAIDTVEMLWAELNRAAEEIAAYKDMAEGMKAERDAAMAQLNTLLEDQQQRQQRQEQKVMKPTPPQTTPRPGEGAPSIDYNFTKALLIDATGGRRGQSAMLQIASTLVGPSTVVKVLCRDGHAEALPPTVENILMGVEWLVHSRSGDRLLLVFAGHTVGMGGDDIALLGCDDGVVSQTALATLFERVPGGAAVSIVCEGSGGGGPLALPANLVGCPDGVPRWEPLPPAKRHGAFACNIMQLAFRHSTHSHASYPPGALLSAFAALSSRWKAKSYGVVLQELTKALKGTSPSGDPSPVLSSTKTFNPDHPFTLVSTPGRGTPEPPLPQPSNREKSYLATALDILRSGKESAVAAHRRAAALAMDVCPAQVEHNRQQMWRVMQERVAETCRMSGSRHGTPPPRSVPRLGEEIPRPLSAVPPRSVRHAPDWSPPGNLFAHPRLM